MLSFDEMTPLVSVITLNWNRKEDLLRTLASIQQQTYSPKELLVVDNGSTDGSVEAVRREQPDAEIIELPQNLGVQGYNEGMARARGEFVLLIDNDMDLLQTNTLERIVHYFASSPKLGAVALQVRDASRIQLSPNNPKYWEEKGDDERGYPCSTFDGGGVAFRKNVLDRIGGFLSQFFVYHSEVDLSTRIWDAGFDIRYFPGIAVSHRESQVARNPSLQTFYTTRNFLWYIWIYYPAGMAFKESLHFLQMSCIQNWRRGKSMKGWLKGVLAAFFQWPQIHSRRKPARKETLEWMQFLRDKDRDRKEKGRENL